MSIEKATTAASSAIFNTVKRMNVTPAITKAASVVETVREKPIIPQDPFEQLTKVWEISTDSELSFWLPKILSKGITTQDIKKLMEAGMPLMQIYQVAGLKVPIDNIVKLLKEGVYPPAIPDILKSGVSLDDTIKLAKSGADCWHIPKILQSKVSLDDAIKLAQSGAGKQILDILNSKVSLDDAIRLAQGGISQSYIVPILQTEMPIDTAIKLSENGIPSNCIVIIARANVEIDKAVKLLKNGILPFDAVNILKANASVNDAIKLSKGGVCSSDIPYILENNLSVDDAIKFCKCNVKPDSLMTMLTIKNIQNIDLKPHDKLTIVMDYKNLDKETLLRIKETFGTDFSDVISSLERNINHIITPITVSKADYAKAFKGFFANNDIELENTLKTANFTDFGLDGLPLKYPRNDFLTNLTVLTKILDEKEQEAIFEKLEITPIKTEGKITGYNGIINLEGLSDEGIEGRVLKIAADFIRNNRIETEDEKLNEALNSLITGFPEFINIIGKQQHSGHSYSLDIHILTMLREVMKNPEYENLSAIDKTCLKIASVLHDIAKEEGKKDNNEHANLSARYVKDILDKSSSLNTETKERIYDLINNHHWLEEYSNGRIDENIIAAMFRRPNDYKLAKIMAQADIKAIGSKSTEESFLPQLSDTALKPVQDALDKINSTGQVIFTNKIIKPELVPTVEYKGKKYRVVDFTRMSDDTDLGKIGFEPNVTTKNARLLIHMIPEHSRLKTIDELCNIGQNVYLCATYSSPLPKNQITAHFNSTIGVSLEVENNNIGNALNVDQYSAYRKEFSNFANDLIPVLSEKSNVARNFVPNIIKRELGLDDSEYQILYKQIAPIKFKGQIQDDKIYDINGKKINGKKIKETIQKAANSLTNIYAGINEINIFSPKINALIAKADTLEELPQELLDYALNKDLPIYLFGAGDQFQN